MKKLAMVMLIPVVLTACGSPQLPTEELRAMKPACAAGDAAVCAEIGHIVHPAQPKQY